MSSQTVGYFSKLWGIFSDFGVSSQAVGYPARLWSVYFPICGVFISPSCGVFSQVKCCGTGWKALGMAQPWGGAAAAPAEGTADFGQDSRAVGLSRGAPGWALIGGAGLCSRSSSDSSEPPPPALKSDYPATFSLPESSLPCPFSQARLLPSAPGGSGTINPINSINSSAASSGRPTAPPSPSFLAICHSQFWCGARS